ncbi:MAG: hypothetical protein MMC33_004592 [Icmadophila ericetorum]|nr:hypothetical protein [Icmadophila ericetorum]
MSTSMTTTVEQRPRTTSLRAIPTPLSFHCDKCGANLPHACQEAVHSAQQKIEELEAQVKILTLRATSAVERATDYEDALRAFASATNSPLPPHLLGTGTLSTFAVATDLPTRPSTANPTTPRVASPATSQTKAPPNSRLSRLLPSRYSGSANSNSQPAPPSTAPLHAAHLSYPPSTPGVYPQTARLPNSLETEELLSALTHEQNLRLAAENAVSQTNEEIEELTGQLFQQANEMVATERRERARLEERVRVLEKRDGEKGRRLEVLEGRLGRIERVRGLLIQQQQKQDQEQGPVTVEKGKV